MYTEPSIHSRTPTYLRPHCSVFRPQSRMHSNAPELISWGIWPVRRIQCVLRDCGLSVSHVPHLSWPSQGLYSGEGRHCDNLHLVLSSTHLPRHDALICPLQHVTIFSYIPSDRSDTCFTITPHHNIPSYLATSPVLSHCPGTKSSMTAHHIWPLKLCLLSPLLPNASLFSPSTIIFCCYIICVLPHHPHTYLTTAYHHFHHNPSPCMTTPVWLLTHHLVTCLTTHSTV